MTCLLHWFPRNFCCVCVLVVGCWLGLNKNVVCLSKPTYKAHQRHNGIEVKHPTFYIDIKTYLIPLYAKFLLVFMRKNDLNSNDESHFCENFPSLAPSRFSSHPPAPPPRTTSHQPWTLRPSLDHVLLQSAMQSNRTTPEVVFFSPDFRWKNMRKCWNWIILSGSRGKALNIWIGFKHHHLICFKHLLKELSGRVNHL